MPVAVKIDASEQLLRVTESEIFHNSEVLCRLLRYLADHAARHPGMPLKEHQIATEALGRSSDFDPRIDSTVRVQTARLRSKLVEYYATQGADDPTLIEIPKGSYLLSLRVRGDTPPTRRAASSQAQTPAVEASVVKESPAEAPIVRRGNKSHFFVSRGD